MKRKRPRKLSTLLLVRGFPGTFLYIEPGMYIYAASQLRQRDIETEDLLGELQARVQRLEKQNSSLASKVCVCVNCLGACVCMYAVLMLMLRTYSMCMTVAVYLHTEPVLQAAVRSLCEEAYSL